LKYIQKECVPLKILIVEDEPKTGDYLRQGLREAGFTVDLVQDGLDGLHLGIEGDQDLIILDVMLPRMDGWSVLQALTQAGITTPVIF
jgi:two-component system copper resistance phosphate regulon response regulator CusR